MSEAFVFDTENARRITERRWEALERLLRELQAEVALETALDAGSGVGYFAQRLLALGRGLRVSAFDVRPQNVEEGRRRLPGVDFRTGDIEEGSITGLGSFDLVVCFGLLYHLENPFRAARHLAALTGKVLVAESIVVPRRAPMAVLREENQGEDQATHYIALIPSESGLVKMLYRAGFAHVYRLRDLPNHEEFRGSLTGRRRRTVLVASRTPLRAGGVEPLPEPRTSDAWWLRAAAAPFDSPVRALRSAVFRWRGGAPGS